MAGVVFDFLDRQAAHVAESAQYRDPASGRLFMRLAFTAPDGDGLAEALTSCLAPFPLVWRLHARGVRPRVLLLVSRFGHCLRDLLERAHGGDIPFEAVAVVSNLPDAAPLAAAAGVPFHHLPVTAMTRGAQEQALLDLIAATEAELVVLARYMQILSPELVARLPCPAINIHHSLLPAFEGARPYSRAHARGVKLIGATAHYVAAGLDDGPIIAQNALAVSHRQTVEDFIRCGRDLECRVLAEAVALHLDRRVFLDGAKTVVLS